LRPELRRSQYVVIGTDNTVLASEIGKVYQRHMIQLDDLDGTYMQELWSTQALDPQNTYLALSPWSDPIAQVDITIVRKSVQPNSPFVPLLRTEVEMPRVLLFPGTGHLHDRYLQSVALLDWHLQHPRGHVYPIWQIMG
ncbi:hypothetical protein HKX48_002217, partial [Thoreauomyces humboldtii]